MRIATILAEEPLKAGVFGALLVSFLVLMAGLGQGILDFHEFRQAQTLLTTYWMSQGGDLLAYETPVVGYPWTIPFEFPVFQWASLLVSKAGLPIVESSRLVAWSFFAIFVWVSGLTLRRLDLPQSVVRIFQILLLCSPLYLFWSRTPMIESTANMFGALCLFGLVGYLKRPNLVDAIHLLIGLTLCALVKVTTMLGFAAAAAILALWILFKDFGEHKRVLRTIKQGAIPLAIAGVAFLALLQWLSFSDGLKSQNPFGMTLTSASLVQFNFGTLEQRLSVSNWATIFLGRAVRDTIGTPVILVIIGWIIYKTRYMVWPSIICFSLFVLPFLIFTNLHFVHNYYQYANSFFLLLFVAFGVDASGQIKSVTFATWSAEKKKNTLLGALVTLQFVVFLFGYWKLVINDQSLNRANAVAARIADVTGPDEVAFAFGEDWSSALAFLSKRRMISLPDAAVEIAPQVGDMMAWTGGRRVAAIVDCEANMSAKMKPYIARITSGMDRNFIANCLVYTPKRLAN